MILRRFSWVVAVGAYLGAHSISLQAQQCKPEGSSNLPKKRALNVLKNRTKLPTAYEKVLLSDLSDSDCNSDRAVEVRAYILDVKRSGPETANCMSDRDLDLHISIASSPDDIPAHSTTVEITPHFVRPDTVSTLRGLRGKSVTIRGYLLFDYAHVATSWRRTACEIHPAISITGN